MLTTNSRIKNNTPCAKWNHDNQDRMNAIQMRTLDKIITKHTRIRIKKMKLYYEKKISHLSIMHHTSKGERFHSTPSLNACALLDLECPPKFRIAPKKRKS